jgi:hypothetical protein
MSHPARLALDELLVQCELKATRRSGPGGQHRNKTDSAIVLTHIPSGITGQASERRSQHENRDVAIARLRINLALALRSEGQPETAPSRLWESRRRGTQITVSESHLDFPALLAEALDVLNHENFEIAPAAERLQISTSQLIRFLKRCPAAIQLLNQARQQRGLGKLK